MWVEQMHTSPNHFVQLQQQIDFFTYAIYIFLHMHMLKYNIFVHAVNCKFYELGVCSVDRLE